MLYFPLIVTVISASLLAYIAQKLINKEKKKMGITLYVLSFVVVLFFLGFRGPTIGVDDYSYNSIFNNVKENGSMQVFNETKLEPGYLLINQIIGMFSGDYQWLIFIMAFLSLGFIYMGMYSEEKSANFFLSFLLFGLMIYPYFFGILRLSLAMSIMFFAIKYYYRGDRIRFNSFILLASSIHYSAALLLMLNIIPKKKMVFKTLRKYYIITLVAIPMVFFVAANILIPIVGDRYLHYATDITQGISLGDFDKLPIILLCLMFMKGISKRNDRYPLYVFLYSIALIISLCSSIIDFGRAQWYFNIYICFILPILVEENNVIKNSKALNYVLIPLVILYGILYSSVISSPESHIVSFDRYENIVIDKNVSRYDF